MGGQRREMQQKPEDGTNHRERADGRQASAGPRIELSVPQVAGSVLAAVTAAILASQLGVYGTIVGAGVVSVVATCGGPLLQHVFSRTGEQLREATAHARAGVPVAPPSPPAPGEPPGPDRRAPREGEFGAPRTYGTRRRGWKRPVAAAAVVFGVAMGGITVYEVAAGEELGGGAGTTVGSAFRPGADDTRPGPTDPADGEDRDTRDGDGTDGRDTDPSPAPTPSSGTGDGSGPGDVNPPKGPDPSGSASPDGGGPAPSPSADPPETGTPAPEPSGSGAATGGTTPGPAASTGTGGR
ncbi:hypothetical protein [Streptomyces sp. t39]|uniref:hypothetical protein n=1 Tax=Streptomyces sp. t39 TaxID=1828156 RepID=UPI0021C8528E|nr:hypothetical protein [Streptomyces sp. t39]